MTGTDTKELRFVPEVEESFTVSPSEWDGHRLEPGDPVRKTLAERIELGQSVQIVRVEVNGDEERIDTVSVPTERWVTIETGTGEQAGRTGGSANVSIEIE